MQAVAWVFGPLIVAGLLIGACYGAAFLAVDSIDWNGLEVLGTPLAISDEIKCGGQTPLAHGVTPTPYPTWMTDFLTVLAGNDSTPSCDVTPSVGPHGP